MTLELTPMLQGQHRPVSQSDNPRVYCCDVADMAGRKSGLKPEIEHFIILFTKYSVTAPDDGWRGIGCGGKKYRVEYSHQPKDHINLNRLLRLTLRDSPKSGHCHPKSVNRSGRLMYAGIRLRIQGGVL